jgi:tetraacyldisaccharide 4'-kinase
MPVNPIKEAIQTAWQRKNWLYFLLVPVSWLFGLLVFGRQKLYQQGFLKSFALPVPVIVVGNINVGGSGKTPVVIWLIEQLSAHGFKPAVISRGYGGTSILPAAVNANSAPNVMGDEPVLIANRTQCPVWVGADRVAVGRALLQVNPSCNVIISDDGLQHYRLQRLIEIAVVTEDIAEASLLPAGSLREPIARLETVDAIICNRKKFIKNSYLMSLQGEQFYNLANPSIKANAVDFKRKTIKAMAGIGKPEQFFAHLQGLGLSFASVSFDDHHAFTQADINNIDSDVLMMTEKDAVKCKQFAKPHHWVLPVNAQIEADLLAKILEKLAQFKMPIFNE